MKLFAAFAAICALSLIAFAQTAIAQTPNCKSIADTSARLACYDKAAPSAAPAAPVRSSASVAAAKADTCEIRRHDQCRRRADECAPEEHLPGLLSGDLPAKPLVRDLRSQCRDLTVEFAEKWHNCHPDAAA